MPLTDNQTPDAPEKRRAGPRRSDASKAAVLDAAFRELVDSGWRGFSVDRVARTAHASKQTIYRWWPTPARLAVEATVSRLGKSAGTGGDVRDRLLALIEPLMVAVRTGDGAHAWRGAILAASDDEAANEDFRAWFNETVRVPLRHVLAEYSVKGAIRKDWDVDMAAELLFGPVWHKLVVMRGPIPELYARKLVDSVLRALAPG